MTIELAAYGVQRPDDWDARLFTYCRGEVAQEAIAFVRASI
jgi:hypothetical protein